MDIVERLKDEDMFMDAIDDAIDEIESLSCEVAALKKVIQNIAEM